MRTRASSLLLALILAAAVLPAAAEDGPVMDAEALVGGQVPAGGGIALLTIAKDTGSRALIDALEEAGCDAAVLGILEGDAWAIYVSGAPRAINAGFPAWLPAGAGFFVRCAAGEAAFTLTLLHHDNGESQLLHAGPGRELYGGIARFKTVADRLRSEAETDATVMISAGGNLMARPEFKASIAAGVPYYDATGMDLIGYDAIVIGSEDFDFGPDVLEAFIRSFSAPVPFVTANLDLSAEPGLQGLADAGRIAPSAVVSQGGVRIGIVGATNPELAFTSSPRDVTVDVDVARAVQAEIDRLTAAGVEVIVFASFLQDLARDQALVRQLHGVDIAVSGGGGELLANAGDRLIPGDAGSVEGTYPLWTPDALGRSVPIVAAPGGYTYIGRLVAGFDEAGRLVSIDTGASGPVRVSGIGPDVATSDAAVQAQVVDPVRDALDALASTVVGTSEVALDLRLMPGVRTQETNAGNLVADAILWQARELADEFGVDAPTVALLNSGGLRGDALFPSGAVTELMTFDIAPFASFVSVVEDVSPTQLKALLENAVSLVDAGDGRFAQVAGLRVTWDPGRPARTYDASGTVTAGGSRIRDVVLDDGTVVVRDGTAITSAPSVDVATIDFLARGGDQYPFGNAGFVTLGATYQQALRNYIRDGLDGRITAADYPEGGEGRVIAE